MFKSTEKCHHYALRKYKVGVMSTLLGMSLLQNIINSPVMAQDDTIQAIDYHYVTETELSPEEHQLLQRFSVDNKID